MGNLGQTNQFTSFRRFDHVPVGGAIAIFSGHELHHRFRQAIGLPIAVGVCDDGGQGFRIQRRGTGGRLMLNGREAGNLATIGAIGDILGHGVGKPFQLPTPGTGR
jgi:hypothetical protein